jgi:tetratricopeptide (TPR) repeat protein
MVNYRFQTKDFSRNFYFIAASLLAERKYNRVIQFCRKAREKCPQQALVFYDLEVKALLAQNLYAETFKLLLEALKKYTGNPVIYVCYGDLYKKIGKDEVAVRYYRKALAKENDPLIKSVLRSHLN